MAGAWERREVRTGIVFSFRFRVLGNLGTEIVSDISYAVRASFPPPRLPLRILAHMLEREVLCDIFRTEF